MLLVTAALLGLSFVIPVYPHAEAVGVPDAVPNRAAERTADEWPVGDFWLPGEFQPGG